MKDLKNKKVIWLGLPFRLPIDYGCVTQGQASRPTRSELHFVIWLGLPSTQLRFARDRLLAQQDQNFIL